MQRIIEAISLFVLIAVTILRPLVPETYDSAETAIGAALGPLSDPSPVHTLIFDLLILLGACGWLLSHAVGPRHTYRSTGLGLGTAIVVLACVISCLGAGNKRLAVNASLDWLCLPVLTIALIQLMYKPWHRRLLLAAVLASACVQAAACFDQYFCSFADTWEHYQGIKTDLWAGQGVELDTPQVELFERRMLAREASGHLPHSNIAASYLVLCGFAAVGLVLATWKGVGGGLGRLVACGAALATAALALAVPLTKSLGAMVSALAGTILWIVLRVLAKWISANRAKSLALGWGVAAAGILAAAGHGLYHGSFPHMSLTFRWKYWLASYDMIADHALTGVGRENFGRHYLRYKTIDSPEEIANPHNLFVQAAADWGLLGFLGVVVMLVGASLALTSEPRPPTDPGPRPAPRSPPEPRAEWNPDLSGARAITRTETTSAIPWTFGLLLVVTLGRLPLLGTDDANYLYYATVTTGIVWLGAFICFAGVRSLTVAGHISVAAAAGIAVGLFAFVLHDMINFAMFVPSTATTAFALLAYCIAERSAPPTEPRASARAEPGSPSPRLTFAAVSGMTALLALFVMRPAIGANRELARARNVAGQLHPGSITQQLAYGHFQQAAARDPWDPTPHAECARWLLKLSTIPDLREQALHLAVLSLDQAVKRDPINIRYPRLRMQLCKTWAEHSGEAMHYHAAIDAAKAALRLYPHDPVGLATLADRQAEAGASIGSGDLLRDAMESYEQALALDRARPAWERIRRFSKRKRSAINAKITRATDLLRQTP